MPQPKLYRLLERLDGRELPWLDKFLASPFFSSSPWPQSLWECLRDAHPRYEALRKEEVFGRLCPGQPFDSKFLNDRYSELSRLVESFFFQQAFRREESLQRRARRAAYRRRGLYPLFSKECHRQASYLLGQPYRSPGNLAEALEIFDAHYIHPESKSHADEGAETSQVMEQLDLHFVLLKLKYACDQLARRLSFNEPLDERFLEAVLEEAPHLEGRHPAIGLYYRLARLFIEGCPDESFQQTKRLFYDLGELLPAAEQSFVLAKLVALAYMRFNRNQERGLGEVYELFQYGEKHRLFIFDGVISDATFLNVCTIAAQTGDFDWARQFIQKNEAFLPEAAKPDAVILGRATVAFAQEDYSGAYHQLNEVYKRQSAYKLRVRSLYVRCLLGMHLAELRHEAPLHSALDAFGQYIRRHPNLSKGRKDAYLNFAKAVKKIALLRSQAWHSSRARAATLEWLSQLQPIILGAWLRKQLERTDLR